MSYKAEVRTKARQEYLEALVDKFPHYPAKTLARAARENAPELFVSDNAAICAVRRLLGAKGAASRHRASRPRPHREPAALLPLPKSEAKPWEPVVVENPGKVGILSDIHLPYHDDKALSAALGWLDGYKPDTILLNGDITDAHAISRWEKDPRKRSLVGEVEILREFLAHIRGRFPRARIIYKLGNHEERFYAYIFRNAPQLVGLDCANWASVIAAEEFGVEVVEEGRIIMLGQLPVLHGHELPKGISNPVSPARGAFLRAIDMLLIGHFHRGSKHNETSMLGRLIVCWSTGCLCDLTPEYARMNRWSHGMAACEVSKGGVFHLQNLDIYNGRVL